MPDQFGGCFNRASLTPVFNRTHYVYYNILDPDPWQALFVGIDTLPTSDYFCALTYCNMQARGYPDARAESWLKRCGASLDEWQRIAGSSSIITYAFIGASNSPPNSGREQLDWDRGTGTVFASAVTPLVRSNGSFTLPGKPAMRSAP